MAIIGYVRSSTTDADLVELQHRELKALSPARIFEDEGYGRLNAPRPGLDAAITALRPGDTFIIWRLDRLGRSMMQVLRLIHELTEKGVYFSSIEDDIDTSTDAGAELARVLGMFGRMEKNLTPERTAIGLAAARTQGKVGGRKPSLSPEQRARVVEMHASKKMTAKEIASVFGVSEPTIYRTVAEHKARQ